MYRVITAGIAGLTAAWLGLLAGDRSLPIKIFSTSVMDASVEAGGTLKIGFSVWREKSCHTRISRSYYDSEGNRFVVPDMDFAAGVLPLGKDNIVIPVQISDKARPGPATLKTFRRYYCNWLHYLFPIIDQTAEDYFLIKEAAEP